METMDVKIPELGEKTMLNVPESATVELKMTVTLYEKFGRAFISWSVDPLYPMGNKDVVQLREGNTFYKNYNVLSQGHNGEVDTGHAWGSGLNAAYWGYDYSRNAYTRVVLTPNTVE